MNGRSQADAIVLFCLAVVAVGVVGAAGALPMGQASPSADSPSASTLQQEGSDITYLSPSNGVEREAYVRAGTDVSMAIGTDATKLEGNFSQYVFEQRYRTTEENVQRDALINETTSGIARSLRSLDTRQNRAIESYNAGEISTEAFLRELMSIDEAAVQHRQYAVFVDDFTLDPVVPDAVNVEAVALPGPVIDQVDAMTRGESSPGAVYVQSGTESMVLATAGETHTRQAVRKANRDRNGSDQFAQTENRIQAAVDRSSELYPWATISSIRSLGGGVYRANLDHPATTVEAYLDGATRKAYYEIQTVDSSNVQSSLTSNTSADLEVAVRTTQASGPMRVTAFDVPANEPVDVSVFVNGYRVGSTGTNGALWVVQPTGELDVRATAPDGGTVTVSSP